MPHYGLDEYADYARDLYEKESCYNDECRGCKSKKKEISEWESGCDIVRDNLEQIVEILTSNSSLDRCLFDNLMFNMCSELGVRYTHSTIDRASFYKFKHRTA